MNDVYLTILIILSIVVVILTTGVLIITVLVIQYFTKSDHDMKMSVNDINKRMLALTSEVILDSGERLTQLGIDRLDETVHQTDEDVTMTVTEFEQKRKQATSEAYDPFKLVREESEDAVDLSAESSNIK